MLFQLPTTLLLTLPFFLQQTYAGNFTNPLKARNGGDPNIVYQDGFYYMMTTAGRTMRMTRARKLDGLKDGETRDVYADSNPERCCNLWAPEMHVVGNSWHIYYAAGPGDSNLQRSHVLKGGRNPWDDFDYLGQIRDDYSVDGTILRIKGNYYFVYSGRDTDGRQSLRIAPMTSAASTGESKVLSRPTQQWESKNAFLNEGPYALYRNGRTWLTFSAGTCNHPSYQLGLLTYDGRGDPTERSSWEKTGPVFSSANGNYGTGHNSFFTSPDGTEVWNVFHSVSNPKGSCGADRRVSAVKVNWNEDGTPDFGEAPVIGVELRGPSGE